MLASCGAVKHSESDDATGRRGRALRRPRRRLDLLRARRIRATAGAVARRVLGCGRVRGADCRRSSTPATRSGCRSVAGTPGPRTPKRRSATPRWRRRRSRFLDAVVGGAGGRGRLERRRGRRRTRGDEPAGPRRPARPHRAVLRPVRAGDSGDGGGARRRSATTRRTRCGGTTTR